MEFKNTICTSREQSKKLLELGLNKCTADMTHSKWGDDLWRIEIGFDLMASDYLPVEDFIPAWTLARLIEICPDCHVEVGSKYVTYYYEDWSMDCEEFQMYENPYDNLIECIKWLISKGELNKEYLL